MGDRLDIVLLRIARGSRALPVIRVVISGVASCHDLPLDRLDDLQLAVETLLAEEFEDGGYVTLELRTLADGLGLRLDGLESQPAKVALLSEAPFRPTQACLLNVRLMLETLVDDYRVVETSGRCFAVEMEKRAS